MWVSKKRIEREKRRAHGDGLDDALLGRPRGHYMGRADHERVAYDRGFDKGERIIHHIRSGIVEAE